MLGTSVVTSCFFQLDFVAAWDNLLGSCIFQKLVHMIHVSRLSCLVLVAGACTYYSHASRAVMWMLRFSDVKNALNCTPCSVGVHMEVQQPRLIAYNGCLVFLTGPLLLICCSSWVVACQKILAAKDPCLSLVERVKNLKVGVLHVLLTCLSDKGQTKQEAWGQCSLRKRRFGAACCPFKAPEPEGKKAA